MLASCRRPPPISTKSCKRHVDQEAQEKLWLKSYDYMSGFSEIDVEQPRALYHKVYDNSQKADLLISIVGQASTIDIESVKFRVPMFVRCLTRL